MPHSEICNELVGPQDCVTVPRVDRRTDDETDVDGVLSQHEYYGAFVLPYDNPALGADGGRVHVSIEDDGTPGNNERLRVFMDDIPVALAGGAASPQPAATEVVVYLDLDRFATEPAGPEEGEDRAYAIPLNGGAAQFREPSWLFGAGTWNPAPPPDPFTAAVGSCSDRVEFPGGPGRTCDLELSAEIPQPFARPAFGSKPGIGFAVADDTFGGMLPELALTSPLSSGDPSLDRRHYQTLLFAEPEGVPISFMSWNIRRFSDKVQNLNRQLAGSRPFAQISLDAIAAVMAQHDIVAIQEGWDAQATCEPDEEDCGDVWEIFRAVNEIRDDAGLEPMHMYGPVQIDPHLRNRLVAEDIPTHGGLWVMSKFLKVGGDNDVFTSCRDLDCAKAKGVQWVELALDPPDEDNTRDECRAGQRAPAAGCPPSPTTENTIHVFNTHLQAGGNFGCIGSAAGGFSAIGAEILDSFDVAPGPLPLIPGLEGWVQGLSAIFAFTLNCDADVANIQRLQLAQAGHFIDEVMSHHPRDMAIIAGDLNTNGRHLEMSEDAPSYVGALTRLGVGPEPMDASDVITPRPGLLDGDIDHGDIGRETSIDWHDVGRGTSIGEGGCNEAATRLTSPIGDCDLPEDSRNDYIFVRPAFPPDTADYESPVYMVWSGRESDDEPPIWRAPFPSSDDPALADLCDDLADESCDPVPGRLSDHRPVIGNLKVVRMRAPPLYHPSREHNFEFRVTQMSAPTRSDCWRGFCNPLDPYFELQGRRTQLGPTPEESFGVRDSETCSGDRLSFEHHSCMSDWFVRDVHEPDVHEFHKGGGRLRESDSTSPDDTYETIAPGDHPLMRMQWEDGVISLIDLSESFTPEGWEDLYPDDYRVMNNDPFRYTTSSTRDSVTLRLSFEERDPEDDE